MLTDFMKQVIREHKTGFVATVSKEGNPNVSPKGTFVILNDQTILFAEIRSPNTLENIKHNPTMEINFLDALRRKGFRAKGNASFIPRGQPEFETLFPLFSEWESLQPHMNGIVKLELSEARLLISPAYDLGETEDDIKAHWKAHFGSL